MAKTKVEYEFKVDIIIKTRGVFGTGVSELRTAFRLRQEETLSQAEKIASRKAGGDPNPFN